MLPRRVNNGNYLKVHGNRNSLLHTLINLNLVNLLLKNRWYLNVGYFFIRFLTGFQTIALLAYF